MYIHSQEHIYTLLLPAFLFTSMFSFSPNGLCRQSSSCVHVSAVLHALTELTPKRALPLDFEHSNDEEEILPVTSQLCRWNVPRKHKESTMCMSEAVFQKHEYSRPNKKPFEDFDPRPVQYRGTAASRLPALLDSVRGQELCVSLLFDKKGQLSNVTSHESIVMSGANVPKVVELRKTIAAFMESLHVNDDKAREFERETRDQRHSSLWYSVHRYRITSSLFGTVLSHRDTSLVLRIVQPKQFSTAATQHGIEMEPIAVAKYVEYQHNNGHPNLSVCSSVSTILRGKS